ncbi:MAG TPA: hypothetical protein VNV61_05660 [Steroidobacteraceae bacterium]|jgi:hypothetical protein|nr:hypothetical protein [Steroidobacteraceae bacterium]
MEEPGESAHHHTHAEAPRRRRSRFLAPILICLTTLAAYAPATCSADGLLGLCKQCDLLVGGGTTFAHDSSTGGLPLTAALELDESRWELGAFRFATAQRVPISDVPRSYRAANPYWGFTAMRRWQVLHRGWGRLYLGFGANYRTEIDYLEATNWNFAYLLATRFDLGTHGNGLELGVRHWSDAWIRPGNRGENILTLSYVF